MIERIAKESFETATIGDSGYRSAGRPGLPGDVVAILLEKLCNEDAFRTLFQQDPAEALKQVGAPNPEMSAQCLRVAKLADKATIRASREALITQLTGTLDLHLPQLIAK